MRSELRVSLVWQGLKRLTGQRPGGHSGSVLGVWLSYKLVVVGHDRAAET